MNYRKKQIFKTSFSILLSIFFLFHLLFFLTNAINNKISIGTAITKKNNKTYDEVELSYFYGQDDKPLDLFLKKFSFGQNVKQFLLPLTRNFNNNNNKTYKFLVSSIPELDIEIQLDCEVTVNGLSENCKTVQYNFFPPYLDNIIENNKNLLQFCLKNNIVNSDCSTLNETVVKKSKRWEDDQAEVTVVPYSFVFRVKKTVQYLLHDLECEENMEWWANTSTYTLLSGTSANKIQFNHSACKFADQLYYLPENLGFDDNDEETINTFILSSTITKELSTILNLGMITYFLAKARDTDFFPPSDFENSMLIYTVELMEAILEVEGRQSHAAMIAALCRRILEDHDAASAHYVAAARLNYPFPRDTFYQSVGRMNGMLFEYTKIDDDNPILTYSVPFKLIHDAEQINHLIDSNIFDDSWKIVANEYMELAKEFAKKDEKEHALGKHIQPENGIPKQILRKIPEDKTNILETYGRILYVRPTPAIFPKSNALGDWDGKLITDMYINTAPSSIATIDNFLSPVAMNEMYQYLTKSTIFLDTKGYYETRGYLGAYMELGMAPGLLFQIVSELRSKIPKILGDYKLTQAWAYKYVEDMDGINVHADDAAVNLNVWITPDDANLNPDDGGLYVYDKQPPDTWNFAQTNEYASNINKFLDEEPKANKINVKYKQNRCVMFHSNLFHETGKLKFKKGFLNRRINLTLLFGGRHTRKRSWD